MVNFLRIVAIFVFVFFQNTSYAALNPVSSYRITDIGFNQTGSDYIAICTSFVAFWSAKNSVSGFVKSDTSSSSCLWGMTGNPNTWSTNIYGGTSCPANSTASGSECSCDSGFEEIGGECKKPPCPEGEEEQGGACVPKKCKPNETRVNGFCVPEPPCPAGEERVNGVCKPTGCPAGKEFGEVEISEMGRTSIICSGGCTVVAVADTCVSWDGKTSCTGTGKYTGSTCTGGEGEGDGGNGGSGGGEGEGNGGNGGGTGGGEGGGTGGGGTGGGGTGGGGTGGGGTGGGGTGGGGTGGGGTGGGGTGGGGTGGGGTGGGGTGGGGTGGGGTGGGSGSGGGGLNPKKPGDDGKCPAGMYKQGNLCFPNKTDPDEEGKCPAGFNKQGKLCVQNPKDPDNDGKCIEGFVKIGSLCYPTRPPGDGEGGGGKGDGDGDGEESSFGGSCAAGFACEGDAIQCAIAKQQHFRNCKLFDDKSPESELYNAEKGKEGNVVKNLEGNETINVSGRIDTSDALGGGGSGVSDLNLTVAGHSVTLPLSVLNDPLRALGSILVAISFLIALRIVGRG